MLGKKAFSIAIETQKVSGLRIVRLIIDSAHHIRSLETQAVVLFIPNRHHLTVIEKTYRLLAHNLQTFTFEIIYSLRI